MIITSHVYIRYCKIIFYFWRHRGIIMIVIIATEKLLMVILSDGSITTSPVGFSLTHSWLSLRNLRLGSMGECLLYSITDQIQWVNDLSPNQCQYLVRANIILCLWDCVIMEKRKTSLGSIPYNPSKSWLSIFESGHDQSSTAINFHSLRQHAVHNFHISADLEIKGMHRSLNE